MKLSQTILTLTGSIALSAAMATETIITDPTNTTGGVTFNVAAGDTLVYSGKITGSGLLKKIGAGTLKLNNPENDFTGGISVLTGYLESAASGCLGSGQVTVNNKDSGGLIFSAAGGVFDNEIVKNSQSGDFLDFRADTTLRGLVRTSGCTMYLLASEGVKVVFKGNVNLGLKPLYFRDMRGTLVFEGKTMSSGNGGVQMQNTTGNEGGKVIYCNSESTMGVLQIGHLAHVCSNENVFTEAVIKPRKDNDKGSVDLNGYDQCVNAIDWSGSWMKQDNMTNALILSEAPATLTIKGTGAGKTSTCNCLIDGRIALVIDADPTYTNQFATRCNLTEGDIHIKSGVFDLYGTGSRFPNVPKITVGSGGTLVSRSKYNSPVFGAVTNLTMASGASLEIQNDADNRHRCPFAQRQLELDIAADSALYLQNDVSITVKTFRVSGVYQHKGIYTNAKCAAIKSGTVVALDGPPRGMTIIVK